ncbi:MAG: hypothetical protein AB7W44_00915 [Pyrinomonadaceae bacterium]
MHDAHSASGSSLPPEKAAYFRWRDNLNGYEDFDSHIDEDYQLRRELKITTADETEWRELLESQFKIEF